MANNNSLMYSMSEDCAFFLYTLPFWLYGKTEMMMDSIRKRKDRNSDRDSNERGGESDTSETAVHSGWKLHVFDELGSA